MNVIEELVWHACVHSEVLLTWQARIVPVTQPQSLFLTRVT